MRTLLISLLAFETAQSAMRAQLPAITNQPESQAIWAGGEVTSTAGVSGTGPFTYQWQLNGADIPEDIMTTIAGNGSQGYNGIGGLATNAQLYLPADIAVDSLGDLFIADFGSYRILKVDTNGVISIVAGNGHGGYSGDGGAATNATIANPTAVALDKHGDLFIADQISQRIREVYTNGIIVSVAGNTPWDKGSYSGDGGPATNASLNFPWGVAIDTLGNLFISDSSNNRIRKIDTNGIITTVAGNGTNGYSGDGGAATNASLNIPTDIAVDTAGNLLISDYGNYRIRKVDTNGIITTVAGNGTSGFSGDGGTATAASISHPFGITWDSLGNFLFADYYNMRIREVGTDGMINTVAGNGADTYFGDGHVALAASLSCPEGVALDVAGDLVIADSLNQRIRKVTNTQSPSLVLNNVTSANCGDYQVVVTGFDGSVTSSVASLIVANSPLIYKSVYNSSGSMTLSFVCPPNSTNVVLCATNLLPPIVWQTVSTNIAGANGDWQFSDTNIPGHQMRFYQSLTR